MQFDPRLVLDQADVIIACDVMSKDHMIVFGRETLERIAESESGEPLAVLDVELDQNTEELEKPYALVQTVKGKSDD